MKRIISMLLCLVMVLSMMPVSAFALDLGGAAAVGSEAAVEEAVIEETPVPNEEPAEELVYEESVEAAQDGVSFTPIWPCNNAHVVHGLDSYFNGGSHNGIDILPDSDSYKYQNIYAVAAGTVVEARSKCTHENYGASHACPDTWGNYICIKHEVNGTTYYSVYAHLKHNSLTVSAGSVVSAGQMIAQMGSSGGSTAYHLHLEVWTGGRGDRSDGRNARTFDYYKNNTTALSGLKFHSGLASSSGAYASWIKNNCKLNGSYYIYSGGSYLNQCTEYSSYLDLEIIDATTLKKYPCSKTTDATSTDIYTPSIGSTYTAYGIWKNTQGNYWYEVKHNGTTCYLFAGDAKVTKHRTDDVSVSGVSAPTSLSVGQAFPIEGKITATYNVMSTVQGYVFSGSVKNLSSATKDPVIKVHREPWVTSYSLKGSPIDEGLTFNTLSAGSYTYMINTVCVSYYSSDGYTLERAWPGKEVIVQTFTVGNVTPAYMSASRTTISLSENTPSQSITFNMGGDLPDRYTLRYRLQDADGYEVSGSPLSLSWGGWNGDSTSITATLTEAATETKYRIYITLFETDYPDDILDSVTITVNCEPIRPERPEVFVVIPDKVTGAPVLWWTAVEEAYYYEIWRSTTGDEGPYSLYDYYHPASLSQSDYKYTDIYAETGVKYHYMICAVNAYGLSSDPSVVDYMTCDYAQPNVSISTNASTGKPKLSWAAVDGATEYEIWRATSSDGTYTKMYTTSNTYYNNTSAVAGRTYYYKVRALGDVSAATSAFSTVKSITCDCARPVVSISCVAASGKPRLSWSAVDGAVSYEVWRSTSKNGTYYKQGSTTGTGYTNTSAVAGKTYYYKVYAVGSSSYAKSAASTVKNMTCDCARPVVSISCNASTGKPKLTWNAVSGATKYEIWRATSRTGTYTKIYTTSNTYFNNTTATANKSYYYKVRAIGSSSYATSAYSSIASITCDCARPVVTASTNSSGKPRLSWSAVDGAVKYEIWRSGYRNGTYTKIYTTTNTYFNNTSAKSGYTYFYKVRAVGSSSYATSAYSSIVSAKATK